MKVKYFWPVPGLFLLISYLIIPDVIIVIATIIAWGIATVFIIGVMFLCAIGWQRFLGERAERKAKDYEAKWKKYQTIQDGFGMVHLLNLKTDIIENLSAFPGTHHNGQWQDPHPAAATAWFALVGSKSKSESPANLLSTTELEERPETLKDLLDSYPHLMIIGGTGSGKTTVINQVINHRLSQYPQAKVLWLSTHTNLDIAIGNVHPRALCVQKTEQIAIALQDILQVYEGRRDKAGIYQQIILAMDEWPELIDDIDNAGYVLKKLSRGTRKTNMNLILASQGGNVGDLGLQGFANVKENFAEIYLNPKLTQENRAVWQMFDNKSSRVEIDLMGPFYGGSQPRVLQLTATVEKKTCPMCSGLVNDNQKYCSNACKQRAYRERYGK